MSAAGAAALAARLAGAVDTARLAARQRGPARHGGVATGGVARQALSAEELQARRWLAQDFGQRAGYRVGIDAAANVYVRRLGRDPRAEPVMTGSHADTQPLGGWLDGAFGIVAGLEVFDALDDLGIATRRPLEVVMWTNEEGSRFAPGLMGSVSYADPGRLADFLAVTDAGGVSFGHASDRAVADFGDHAARAGWAGMARRLGEPVHAYIEAHIEQGPVLEAQGLQVGCVSAIQGVRWYRVTVPGRSAHAGTTPLASRDDAQAKAIRMAHAVLEHARAGDDRLRVTIGRWECAPGSINTIADRVSFTVDARHPEARALDAVRAVMDAALPEGGRIEVLQDKPTVHFAPELVALALSACQALGLPHRRMLSGAFHDAMPMAGFCPAAMLFAPSVAGVSHHPAEDTAIADLAACTRALAWCLLHLAEPCSS
ncbi:M20 family metallo-hydrolase [Bordetella hinzii]|uniref:M20 family metallo-hydrolase n=1 Tax=Bordetella hinzii TaxID=103855 RepID=UPI001C01431E|nr:M20 family metallo-hydrolase [Bordetella hinzii]QWF38705.1 M20 family metallo-hydrolase [Bordetella hinzii]